MVDNYPELKQNLTLHTGGLISQFIETVGSGGNIDMLFLDAAHRLPGEIMDFLTILPYLNEDALIVIHDIHHYTRDDIIKFAPDIGSQLCNTMLFSALRGKYYLNDEWKDCSYFLSRAPNYFHGIGAIILDKQKCLENLLAFFNPLTYRWTNLPTKSEEIKILSHFSSYYDKFYVDYLRNIFTYQRMRSLDFEKIAFEKTTRKVVVALMEAGEKSLADFIQTNKKRVLYGAGEQGRNCFYLFWAKCGINIEGLIYSSPGVALASIDLLGKCFHVDEFPYQKDDCAVLISVNEVHNKEITDFLQNKGYNHIYTANNWINAMEIIKSNIFE
jgi:membrane-bound inhibitor of C-type lysozyme